MGPGPGATVSAVNFRPNTVVPFPDSKIATYTFVPSGLTAIARGRSASMAMFATAARVIGSMTNTALVREQEIQAPRGFPANTRSLGPAGVSRVATTLSEERSRMLIV